MSQKTHIVIHHTLTADGLTVNWQAIRRYHVNERGWTDIGYHFGVELVGNRFETIVGRMPDLIGAHTRELQMNMRAFGICLVGNFDVAPPPDDQMNMAAALCGSLMRMHRIAVRDILGHREIGALAGFDWTAGEYKSCPGRMFDMDMFRSRCKYAARLDAPP